MSESLMGDTGAPADAPVDAPPVEGGAPPSEGIQAPEWLSGVEGIDEELLADPSIKAIQDIPSLLKSYVHGQRMIGKDKVVIPTEKSSEAEWNDFYAKLGKPTELDKFTLEKGDDSPLEDEYIDSFRKAAFEANILPGQAQKLLQALNQYESDSNARFIEQGKAQLAEATEGLKSEWGEAFQHNVQLSQKAAREFGGDEFIQYLNESGLGNDVNLVKIFNKIGKTMFKEDSPEAGRATGGVMTPDEARAKFDEIMRDPNDPYHNASTIGHKRRVEEVQKLFVAMG